MIAEVYIVKLIKSIISIGFNYHRFKVLSLIVTF
jgi:hypothetical protein